MNAQGESEIGNQKQNSLLVKPGIVVWMVITAAFLLFGASSWRHALFQSGAFDLGYFDQAIYLISKGLTPIVSFWGYHFLGGHADWILYPISLLYKIYPSVHWLFAIQAGCLAIAAIPVQQLALQMGLKPKQSVTMAAVYLLYPLIFNINLFDFHPEVIALPLLFAAVLAAKQQRIIWFTVCILLILGCRDALSLTVAAMGVWLLLFERQRICGAIALTAGVAWFLIATQVIIPSFRPAGVESVFRYAYLGNSVLEIARNLVLRPDLVLSKIFSLGTLEYFALLLSPLFWGLSIQHFAPLVAALPPLVMNILSDAHAQRDLVHQYSLPILPFLLLVVMAAWADQKTWLLRSRRSILLWSLFGFLCLAKYNYLGTRYLKSWDTVAATRQAMALIQTKGSVLTTHEIVPHLTHRPQIYYTDMTYPARNLNQFDYVLLNSRHPGWVSSREYVMTIVKELQANSQFQLQYQRDGVYLFAKREMAQNSRTGTVSP